MDEFVDGTPLDDADGADEALAENDGAELCGTGVGELVVTIELAGAALVAEAGGASALPQDVR